MSQDDTTILRGLGMLMKLTGVSRLVKGNKLNCQTSPQRVGKQWTEWRYFNKWEGKQREILYNELTHIHTHTHINMDDYILTKCHI